MCYAQGEYGDELAFEGLCFGHCRYCQCGQHHDHGENQDQELLHNIFLLIFTHAG